MLYYIAKNTLYLNSDLMKPDTKGMSFKDHCEALDRARIMSAEKRVEKYCPEQYKAKMLKAIKEAKKKGMGLSEFSAM